MSDDRRPEPHTGPRCPICGRPRDRRFRPFCSAHCRDQDLLHWLDGTYAIPVVDEEPDDEEPRTGDGNHH